MLSQVPYLRRRPSAQPPVERMPLEQFMENPEDEEEVLARGSRGLRISCAKHRIRSGVETLEG